MYMNVQGIRVQDSPGGTVHKNLSASAGNMGLIPGPGRFHMAWATKAHVPQLLSPCAGTTEACASRAHALQQEKPPRCKAHALQLENSPCSL